MFELLFLLLPIAAGYGWYMGNRSARQEFQKEENRFSREYVDGLSFLLSNQQDKAVDFFLDMIKDDSNTLDAHLTLGNLFRSRGEVDRALRIHQALIENTSLSYDQRLLAHQQLGLDYMVAGLYDRAENTFLQLVDEPDFSIFALQQLLQIYQMTSDWEKSIVMAKDLIDLGKDEYRNEAAHFYCELALNAISGDNLDRAKRFLKQAQSMNKECVRTNLMMGRVLVAEERYGQAIPVLQKVLSLDKMMINEALPMLKKCYEKINEPEKWRRFLAQCVARTSGVTAELMLADDIEGKEGSQIAQAFIHQVTQRHPSLAGFSRLMDYYIAGAEEGKAKESLVLLRNIVEEQSESVSSYVCQKCGFSSNILYWHCPSCRSWSSMKYNSYYKYKP